MHPVMLRVRESGIGLLAADLPQDTINKTGQMILPQGLRLLNRLINSGCFRDSIHKENLVKCYAEYV